MASNNTNWTYISHIVCWLSADNYDDDDVDDSGDLGDDDDDDVNYCY